MREVRAPEKDKVGKRLFPALGGSLGIGREALAISFDLLLQGGGNVGNRVPELFSGKFFHFPYSFSIRSPNGSSTSKSAEACCGKCLIVKSASILIRLVDVLSSSIPGKMRLLAAMVFAKESAREDSASTFSAGGAATRSH